MSRVRSSPRICTTAPRIDLGRQRLSVAVLISLLPFASFGDISSVIAGLTVSASWIYTAGGLAQRAGDLARYVTLGRRLEGRRRRGGPGVRRVKPPHAMVAVTYPRRPIWAASTTLGSMSRRGILGGGPKRCRGRSWPFAPGRGCRVKRATGVVNSAGDAAICAYNRTSEHREICGGEGWFARRCSGLLITGPQRVGHHQAVAAIMAEFAAAGSWSAGLLVRPKRSQAMTALCRLILFRRPISHCGSPLPFAALSRGRSLRSLALLFTNACIRRSAVTRGTRAVDHALGVTTAIWPPLAGRLADRHPRRHSSADRPRGAGGGFVLMAMLKAPTVTTVAIIWAGRVVRRRPIGLFQ